MKYIIFDLDGTLLDSVCVWKHLGIEYLCGKGIKPLITPEQMDIELEIRNLPEGALYLKEEYGLSDTVEEIITAMYDLVKQRYLSSPLKDMIYEKDVLKQLVADGYQLYVLTSSFEEIAKLTLKQQGVDHYFQAIESIAPHTSKGNGSSYVSFMQKHGLNVEDVVVVEDAYHAVQGVKKIGAKVIVMEETYFPMNAQGAVIGDGYVKNYQELYRALKIL